jgi:hypothetical protein
MEFHMPDMADIVVKKADGTTNITFNKLTASSGDKVPAQWRQEATGASASLRPTFEMVSQWNGPRTARRVSSSFQYPYTVTDSTTSTTTVKDRIPYGTSMVVPTAVPDTIVSEAVAQGTNLQTSPLVVASYKAGYSPT